MILETLTYAKFDTGSLTDPIGSSPIVAAVGWLQQTLLGTIATTVAIVAVASVGFLMLSGRIDYRRGITVILGCFVLFGASSIVAGIQTAIATGEAGDEYPIADTASPLPAALAQIPQRSGPSDHDPYAGAAVPRR